MSRENTKIKILKVLKEIAPDELSADDIREAIGSSFEPNLFDKLLEELKNEAYLSATGHAKRIDGGSSGLSFMPYLYNKYRITPEGIDYLKSTSTSKTNWGKVGAITAIIGLAITVAFNMDGNLSTNSSPDPAPSKHINIGPKGKQLHAIDSGIHDETPTAPYQRF